MKALALIFAVAVAGCTSVRGQGEFGMTEAEIDQKDHNVCASFGLSRGSSGYADCRLRLRSDRSMQDSSRRLRGVILAR